MRKKTTASRPADSMISSSEGFQARVTHPGDGSSVWMENGSLSFTSFRWSRSIWRVEYTPAFPGWFRNIEYKIKKIVASPILIPAEVARSEISITPAPKPNPLLFSPLESLYTNFLLYLGDEPSIICVLASMIHDPFASFRIWCEKATITIILNFFNLSFDLICVGRWILARMEKR